MGASSTGTGTWRGTRSGWVEERVVHWSVMVTKRPATGARSPSLRKRKPLGRVLADLGRKIPAGEAAKMPRDGAANHDHYIYGTPKQY